MQIRVVNFNKEYWPLLPGIFALCWSYASINFKPDHPPGDPWGFAHSSCHWGLVFASLYSWGLPPGGGVLNQRKSSIISIEKSAIFALSLKQMAAPFIGLYIYARSEQCDSGPVTNTQRIRIYPGKLKSILVKVSPDPGR